jgi:hypothetical protein
VPEGYISTPRPQADRAGQLHHIICYCAKCDSKVESELSLSLSEYCSCDQYTRWICLSCKKQEEVEAVRYFEEYTKMEWATEENEDDETIMKHIDHQFTRFVSTIISSSVCTMEDLALF